MSTDPNASPAPSQSTRQFQEDKVRIGTTMRELFAHMWPHFMKQKVLFFATLAAVFAVAIAGRLTVTLFGMAIDDGILKGNRGMIVAIAIAFFFIETGRCFMIFLHNYLFAKVGNRILFDIRDQLVRHVQSLPISYFEKNPTGRIVTRLTSDVVALGELFTQGLISVFASLVSLLTIVIAMALISVKMTVITLLITPPLVWIVMKLSQKILVAQRESKGKLASINAYLSENIGGMRILQLYGRARRNYERFRGLSGEYRDQQMKIVLLYALLWPTISFFNATSVALAFAVGGFLTIEGAVTTGAMIAFILHVRTFMDPLHVILEKYQVLQNSLSGAERIFTLLDEKPEESPDDRVISLESARIKGEVELGDVVFKYASHLPPALDGVSLSVKQGESVALVGRTGSGKSTLISLLQRFHETTSGRITIDGRDIKSYSRSELRARVGVVQQDTFMFRGTIAENISLCDPSISRESIERAAKLACLAELLERKALGLESRVEERGANLSVGERQLIAFARILAFEPDVLILDEATANIDSRTESLIQEATLQARQGRTCFIIAHRISTILDCDKIVVLDGGRIAEVGSHKELLAQAGLYAALCRAQFKESKSESVLA